MPNNLMIRFDSKRKLPKTNTMMAAAAVMTLAVVASPSATAEALSPVLFKRVIAKRDQFDQGVRAIIQQGIDQGVFKPGDPKLIEFAMMGAVNWIPKWFDPQGPATSDQIGTAFADYLVGGLLNSGIELNAPNGPRR